MMPSVGYSLNLLGNLLSALAVAARLLIYLLHRESGYYFSDGFCRGVATFPVGAGDVSSEAGDQTKIIAADGRG
jgi:hypothetical protein